MYSLATSLRDAAELYRRWPDTMDQRGGDVPAEHHAILDVVLARDATAAAEALSAHIQHTTDLLPPRAAVELATVDDSEINPVPSAPARRRTDRFPLHTGSAPR